MFFVIVISFYYFFISNRNTESLIINQGIINFKNMFKSCYSINSLVDELKRNNITFLNRDICAFLRNNKLLFYIKKDNLYDSFIPVIIDGSINRKALIVIKKSSRWLDNFLYERNCSLSDIRLLLYYKNVFYLIKK